MKRLLTTMFFAMWVGFFGPRCQASVPPYPTACAAFSQRGDLAEVTVDKGVLSFRLIRPDGGEKTYRETIAQDEEDCQVFFPVKAGVVAVVTRIGKEGARVRAWNSESEKWESRFDIEPRSGLVGRLSVRGFWNGGPDLVVTGRQRESSDAPLTSMLVDSAGNVVSSPGNPRPAFAVDARRNRAWSLVKDGPKGCISRPVRLTDGSLPSPGSDLPELPCDCFAGGLRGFPTANSVVGANGKGNGGTWVWACQSGRSSPSKLLLSSPPKRFLDRWVDSGPADLTVSPDGKFFAVVVGVTEWWATDTVRSNWNDVYVFQTEPLRELSGFKGKGKCRALYAVAVGDFAGIPHVAMNWCGKWEIRTVVGSEKGAKPSNTADH